MLIISIVKNFGAFPHVFFFLLRLYHVADLGTLLWITLAACSYDIATLLDGYDIVRCILSKFI